MKVECSKIAKSDSVWEVYILSRREEEKEMLLLAIL